MNRVRVFEKKFWHSYRSHHPDYFVGGTIFHAEADDPRELLVLIAEPEPSLVLCFHSTSIPRVSIPRLQATLTHTSPTHNSILIRYSQVRSYHLLHALAPFAFLFSTLPSFFRFSSSFFASSFSLSSLSACLRHSGEHSLSLQLVPLSLVSLSSS